MSSHGFNSSCKALLQLAEKVDRALHTVKSLLPNIKAGLPQALQELIIQNQSLLGLIEADLYRRFGAEAVDVFTHLTAASREVQSTVASCQILHK